VSFAPGDVTLTECNPLGGTLGRVEREIAAALLVRVCQVRGSFGPVRLAEIEDLIATGDPWTTTLLRNPFQTPNFDELVARGFARVTEPDPLTLELTETGLDRIGRSIWVRS
jgi:hypothetical protein